jgi:NAD(P)-dependent dehydrogenase (short-subunit alcohol dehydrogenase family)
MHRQVVITGASSGLGLQLAERFHHLGDFVTAIGLRFPYNVETEKYKQVALDITDPHGLALFATGFNERASCDILINCAAINKIGYIEDFNVQDFEHVMDVNVKGAFMMVKVLLSGLIRSKGTILNIVSNASHMPMTASTAYNASKGAMHIMTLQMARELTRRHGITVFKEPECPRTLRSRSVQYADGPQRRQRPIRRRR